MRGQNIALSDLIENAKVKRPVAAAFAVLTAGLASGFILCWCASGLILSLREPVAFLS